MRNVILPSWWAHIEALAVRRGWMTGEPVLANTVRPWPWEQDSEAGGRLCAM